MAKHSGGMYRIEEQEFPVPITEWEPQTVGVFLTGLPVLSAYYIHRWTWPGGVLSADYMDALLTKFAHQQSTAAQLTALETDPHDASGGCQTYGTTVYTKFVINQVTPIRRELPHYGDVTVTFEVDVT